MYLTEDDPGGKLYRFTPDAYPDLSAGVLEAAVVAPDASVSWVTVPDPSAATTPVREQVPEATTFPGNEGIWYHAGTIVFTSKGDNRVHAIDIAAGRYSQLWDGTSTDPLSGVDNITVATASGDVFVAEDGGNMELVLVTPDGDVVPFARVAEPGHEGSEITGPAFSPDGTRLYFSSQRGPTPGTLTDIAGDRGVIGDTRNGGTTWEVTGPFRTVAAAGDRSTATTLAGAAEASGATTGDGSSGNGGDGGSSALPLAGGAVIALGAAGAGAWWLRTRRARPAGERGLSGEGGSEDAVGATGPSGPGSDRA